MESILTSIKKLLGIAEEYTEFDADIIMQINMAFSELRQIGVGPDSGFMIHDDSATWTDFLGYDMNRFQMVKTYIYLKVKLVFDPPNNSYLSDVMQKQISEIEWRIDADKRGDLVKNG